MSFCIKRFISEVERIAREVGKYQVHGIIQLLMLLLAASPASAPEQCK